MLATNLNAQTDGWKFSRPYKKNHTVLILGNMSPADTITLKIGGVTLINNLTISPNDTINCKGYYENNPLYYVLDADNISHFFGIDINGKYQIDYLIWFRNPHKIKKICNALDSSERYLNFTRNGDLGSYEVEVILNGNRYTSIGHWDKRFCYLFFFTENGQRTVTINHNSRFYGLI